MLPQNLLTLVNPSSLDHLPLALPANAKFEYQARFLPSGPDAAIELTPTVTRTYINGAVCEVENAFTFFVDNYQQSLARAYRKLAKRRSETVVLTGRWHAKSLKTAYFEAVLLHVVDVAGGVRTIRYDLEIFDNDYHQSAMGFFARGEICAAVLTALRLWSDKLTSPMKRDLTSYGAPIVDGVAWLSDDATAPPIFCHNDWPVGLSKQSLEESLKLNPVVKSNSLEKPVTGPISLGHLMNATSVPIYYTQIDLGDGELDEPQAHYYQRDECCWSDTLLFETSEIEGMLFASEWVGESDSILFRTLV
ncbi:hypothetical protein AB4Z52_32325 [Rhizobium sp. 2YAF20]|uniref:hypothetical protein n=1 Tax=Rhizobium sp. 2YAF20 TaxID=3233027 RepID=UPI003F968D8B